MLGNRAVFIKDNPCFEIKRGDEGVVLKDEGLTYLVFWSGCYFHFDHSDIRSEPGLWHDRSRDTPAQWQTVWAAVRTLNGNMDIRKMQWRVRIAQGAGKFDPEDFCFWDCERESELGDEDVVYWRPYFTPPPPYVKAGLERPR